VSCPPADQLLDLAAGRLAGQAHQDLLAHAADCPECRVALSALTRDQQRPSIVPGARLERYVLAHRLGQGSMGVVWSAHDPELGRQVAIKLLHVSAADPGQPPSGEARALARIAHPNVVPVFDAGVASGRAFVVMEQVEGGTLRTWLATPRPWPEVVRVFLDAGRGLAAVHAAGLRHGDLKPENVLIGADGRARVSDFGLAALAGERAEGVHGTAAYLAPEQVAGKTIDARADQFAFCVALREALAGEGEGASPAPGWLRRIVERGLSPDPAARFPSMDALLAALEHGPRRRRRWLAAMAAVPMLGLLVLLLAYQVPRPDRTCRIESRRLGEQLRDRLAGTGGPEAGRAVQEWVTARVGACEEAGAVDPEATRRLRLRLSCLEQWRLDALRSWSAPPRSPGECLGPVRELRGRRPRTGW
jgi:hypothetical protein